MKTRNKRKAAMLASILALMLAVPQAVSAEPQEDAQLLVVNESTVAFAGHEWWVIGDGTSGVNPQQDTLTLLAKQDEFGKSVFRTGHGNEFEGSTYDSANKMYYANNPDGTSWVAPTEYAGSTLQLKMDAIGAEFSEKELAAIQDRTLQGGGTVDTPSQDGIAGPAITQKLWALSKEEWEIIDNNTVRSFGDQYLLRTPHPYYGRARKARADGATNYVDSAALAELAVRPTLSLDSSKILSITGSSDKSAVAVGNGFSGMPAPTGTMKLTLIDNSQALKIVATEEQKNQTSQVLSFRYENATTGRGQGVSCILVDINGDTVYYAKLADCSTAASGTLSIPVEGVAQGRYTLKIFSEEANGDLYADFASEPVTMTVDVSEGTATVSDYTGDVIHQHALTKVGAKDATCTEDGNVEYWFCEKCSQYFSDEVGTSTITLEQTVVKATGHHYENGRCTVCGDTDPGYKPDGAPKAKASVNPEEPVKTGDNSILWLYSLLITVCGGGLAAVIAIKKRGQRADR